MDKDNKNRELDNMDKKLHISDVSDSKNFYIFYSEGTNHNERDDVAITEAYNLDEAITFFKLYYTNANKKNVKIIDCNSDGYKEGWVKGIMIVSKY